MHKEIALPLLWTAFTTRSKGRSSGYGVLWFPCHCWMEFHGGRSKVCVLLWQICLMVLWCPVFISLYLEHYLKMKKKKKDYFVADGAIKSHRSCLVLEFGCLVLEFGLNITAVWHLSNWTASIHHLPRLIGAIGQHSIPNQCKLKYLYTCCGWPQAPPCPSTYHLSWWVLSTY